MQKCGVYLRVSTKEQAQHGWSIDGQYNEIREWVDRNKPGMVVTRRYSDPGFSASTLVKILSSRRYIGWLWYSGLQWQDQDIRIVSDNLWEKVNQGFHVGDAVSNPKFAQDYAYEKAKKS